MLKMKENLNALSVVDNGDGRIEYAICRERNVLTSNLRRFPREFRANSQFHVFLPRRQPLLHLSCHVLVLVDSLSGMESSRRGHYYSDKHHLLEGLNSGEQVPKRSKGEKGSKSTQPYKTIWISCRPTGGGGSPGGSPGGSNASRRSSSSSRDEKDPYKLKRSWCGSKGMIQSRLLPSQRTQPNAVDSKVKLCRPCARHAKGMKHLWLHGFKDAALSKIQPSWQVSETIQCSIELWVTSCWKTLEVPASV